MPNRGSPCAGVCGFSAEREPAIPLRDLLAFLRLELCPADLANPRGRFSSQIPQVEEPRMSDRMAKLQCGPCRDGVEPLGRQASLAYLAERPNWSLGADGKHIEREFRFRCFADALAFVNEVGAIAEEQGHHPDISFGWGYASIRLQTHSIGGLHENDFILAAKIDILPFD